MILVLTHTLAKVIITKVHTKKEITTAAQGSATVGTGTSLTRSPSPKLANNQTQFAQITFLAFPHRLFHSNDLVKPLAPSSYNSNHYNLNHKI